MSDAGVERGLDSMSQWTNRTASVLAAVPSWSAEVRCLDLTEEVGELARAILVAEGRKPTELGEPIAQALCGVLFDVFALAEQYQIDLDVQYGEQLAQLAERWASRRPAEPYAEKSYAGARTSRLRTEVGDIL